MRVLVTTDQHFLRTPDGSFWTSLGFDHSFWQRYLDVFDEVCVIARVGNVVERDTKWHRADGSKVSFLALTDFRGPWQYLTCQGKMQRLIDSFVRPGDAVVLRVGSQIAALVERAVNRTGQPYAVEVIGDPFDVFSPGAMRSQFRPLMRSWFARQLRRQCARACAAAYVTERALQQRYAPGIGLGLEPASCAFVTSYSSIDLTSEAFVAAPRSASGRDEKLRIVSVGTMSQPYKAFDVLIRAAATCLQDGIDLSLRIVGDGRYREELERLSVRLDLNDRVQFLGELLTPEAIRSELDRSDLFILASRAEGLPRVMIEAMARGLPCIGSNVGGIPELLDTEVLVPSGDSDALSSKIRELVLDPERRAAMSARNLSRAHGYRLEILRERRRVFYRHVRDCTVNWFENQSKQGR